VVAVVRARHAETNSHTKCGERFTGDLQS
jgi:hypothetical protein